MVKCVSLVGGAFLATLIAFLADAAVAESKVGITSATHGDPLGKPPSESERVLRVGIDVQANELITTRADDRAHLMFLDGTSLTVGPNAQLTIDKFIYDPTSKQGELAINVSKGVFRLVGGKISKTKAIIIDTPSSTIGIRGGITIGDVQPTQTTSTFVFGRDLTVSSQGVTQIANRPGSSIVTKLGSVPGLPFLVAHGALSGPLGQLEGVKGGNSSGGTGSSPSGTAFVGNADRGAQTFGTQNVPPPAVVIPPQAITLVNSDLITNAIAITTQNVGVNTAPSTTEPSSTGSSPSGLGGTGSSGLNGHGCFHDCGRHVGQLR